MGWVGERRRELLHIHPIADFFPHRACGIALSSCYWNCEAVIETSESLPLCSECYAHVAEELSQGQVVDIPLKSARL